MSKVPEEACDPADVAELCGWLLDTARALNGELTIQRGREQELRAEVAALRVVAEALEAALDALPSAPGGVG